MEDTNPGRARRRLDEKSWRAVLERFDGATMTVQEFCLREGLTRSSFTRWRSRLRSTAKRAAAAVVKPSGAESPQPSFVDLGLLGRTAPSEIAVLDLRIELGGGISLHLVRR